MGALHKTGFTYHKKQICRGNQWSPAKNVKKIKQAIRESPLQQKDREHKNSLSFFTRLALQGMGCYTFLCTVGQKLAFSCGRRGTAIAVDEELLCV